MLWKRAYRTKISDGHDEAIGRVSTPETAIETAQRNWVAEAQREHEVARDHRGVAPEAASRGKI